MGGRGRGFYHLEAAEFRSVSLDGRYFWAAQHVRGPYEAHEGRGLLTHPQILFQEVGEYLGILLQAVKVVQTNNAASRTVLHDEV